MARPRNFTPEILDAALLGLEAQRKRLTGQIADVKRLLGSDTGARPAAAHGESPRRKRTMTAAARKRIADAQRKRWDKFHRASKEHAPAKKKSAASRKPAKRRISAAGRKAIAEAARKRWAEYRKKAKAPAPKKSPATKKSAA